MLLTIIIFVLTLLVLIVSHEFGHFIMAKKFGVKVLEFGLGLPPKIFSKKIGETPFSVNWLPIGGFVRLLGEDETDRKVLSQKGSFATRSVWQRIGIVVAGVVMNLLLAMILFWAVLAAQNFKEEIPLFLPYQFFGVNQQNETVLLVGKVGDSSPAQKEGIRAGDRIIALNSQSILGSENFIKEIKEKAGEKIKLTVVDPGNKTRIIEIIPRKDPPENQGALGVELGSLTVAKLSYPHWYQKLGAGAIRSYNLVSYSGLMMGKLFGQAFSTKDFTPVSENLAGPVGITNLTNSILQIEAPLLPFLDFVAMLSLNLAVINILPFPALDGGRLIFLLSEAIFRKRVKAEVERVIHLTGMAFLIGLIILITFSDIKKLLP